MDSSLAGKTIEEPARGDAAVTRARLLAVAKRVFSRRGYSESGIRDIAGELGLSSTILLRYFGSKAALFEAALRDGMSSEPVYPPRDQFGAFISQRLADPAMHMNPHAMIVLATAHEEAREIATRVLHEHAVAPLARWLGPPDAEARARQIFALCAGFVLYTFQLIPGGDHEQNTARMVEWLARSVQAIVDAS